MIWSVLYILPYRRREKKKTYLPKAIVISSSQSLFFLQLFQEEWDRKKKREKSFMWMKRFFTPVLLFIFKTFFVSFVVFCESFGMMTIWKLEKQDWKKRRWENGVDELQNALKEKTTCIAVCLLLKLSWDCGSTNYALIMSLISPIAAA